MKALAIEKRENLAQDLSSVLGPEIIFDGFDFTSSPLKAVKSHDEEEYQICFISEAFPTEDLGPFFDDIRAMNRDLGCIYVQVRETIEPGTDRTQLKELGVDFIVSRAGTQRDKEGIADCISEKLGNDEIKRRVLDVSSAMDVLLRQLDIAAENKKRGRADHMQLDKLAMDFIEMQTQFDQEVLQRYFQTLTKKAESAEPSIASALDVPKEILEKDLPKLSKHGYKGASHRVWQKLMQLHGVDSIEPAHSGASKRVIEKTENQGEPMEPGDEIN